jgi:hypothetical protein
MELPEYCPFCCDNVGELESREFDAVNGVVDEKYYCPICDAEWNVMYVVVEKTVTASHRNTC